MGSLGNTNEDELAIRTPFELCHDIGELKLIEDSQRVCLENLDFEILGDGYQITSVVLILDEAVTLREIIREVHILFKIKFLF